MRFRKLRIAWSVAWGVACVLLIVLWWQSRTEIKGFTAHLIPQRFTMVQLDRLRNRVFELQTRLAERRAGARPGALLRGARRRLGRWRAGRAWPLPETDGGAVRESRSRRAATR